MTSADRPTLDYQPPPPRAARDDVAYFVPMATFLAFVWAAGHWPALYAPLYVVKSIIVAILLCVFWKHYTKVRWNFWWLGVILGIVGIVQWVGMQLLLQRIHIHLFGHSFEPFKPSADAFNPMKQMTTPAIFWSWIAVRIAGAALVVPVMEELFWRDFLWRTIIAPNDFKLAEVGEWDWKAFVLVAGFFATVHGNWWLTSIVWALMIGWLLVKTKSLGACIIMHSVTNLLLGVYVLCTRDWSFW